MMERSVKQFCLALFAFIAVSTAGCNNDGLEINNEVDMAKTTVILDGPDAGTAPDMTKTEEKADLAETAQPDLTQVADLGTTPTADLAKSESPDLTPTAETPDLLMQPDLATAPDLVQVCAPAPEVAFVQGGQNPPDSTVDGQKDQAVMRFYIRSQMDMQIDFQNLTGSLFGIHNFEGAHWTVRRYGLNQEVAGGTIQSNKLYQATSSTMNLAGSISEGFELVIDTVKAAPSNTLWVDLSGPMHYSCDQKDWHDLNFRLTSSTFTYAPYDCSGNFGVCTVNGYKETLANGTTVCSTDVGGSNSQAVPEVCGNGLDDDCDGVTDNGCPVVVGPACDLVTNQNGDTVYGYAKLFAGWASNTPQGATSRAPEQLVAVIQLTAESGPNCQEALFPTHLVVKAPATGFTPGNWILFDENGFPVASGQWSNGVIDVYMKTFAVVVSPGQSKKLFLRLDTSSAQSASSLAVRIEPGIGYTTTDHGESYVLNDSLPTNSKVFTY